MTILLCCHLLCSRFLLIFTQSYLNLAPIAISVKLAAVAAPDIAGDSLMSAVSGANRSGAIAANGQRMRRGRPKGGHVRHAQCYTQYLISPFD